MTTDTTRTPSPGEPFPCPECDATDRWWADYFEPVSQSIALISDGDGEPELADYTGSIKSYSDGATSAESYRCGNCGHLIELGAHVYVPAGTPPFADVAGMLSNARTALDDPAAIRVADLAPFVEKERRLRQDDGPPAGAHLYALHQLDEAINALRRIYEPEEVAAES